MGNVTLCRWTCSCLLATIVLLTGCGPKYIEFPAALSSQSQGLVRIPLRAGLCMPPNFREFVVPMYRQDYQDFYGKFGEALTVGAEGMAKKAFKEVVVLAQAEEAASQRVDVVVTPAIDYIGFDYGDSTATVKVKWTVADVSGRVLYMNTFIGQGDGKGTSFRYPTKLKKACTRAIEDHFDKTLVGLSGSRWWEAIVPNR